MRKVGSKYVLKESEMRHLVNLCILAEDMEIDRRRLYENAEAPTGNTQQPLDQQDKAQLAQIAQMPQDEKVQAAKEEVQELLNGQENPRDPFIREFLRMIFGGTSLWDLLARTFGWDAGDTRGTANGNGQEMDMSKAVPYSEWLKDGGQQFSASSLTNVVILSPNNSGQRKYKVSKITIHHMAGVGSAEQVGAQFAKKSRRASSNYGIGNDGKIAMYVPENYAAWTSSSSNNDQQAITIEVSNSRSDKGARTDFNDPNQWPVGDAALRSLVALCRDICSRYGITPTYTGDANGSFTEHRMFASTACPGPFLHSGLAGGNGQEGWLIRAIKGGGIQGQGQ